MKREYIRLGLAITPQQKEEQAELTQQIKTEQDEITTASTRLRQRHEALLQEASLLNVRLEDLVELDF